jgi:outer membrane protein OmpA-like peptidoglycan-associated protein
MNVYAPVNRAWWSVTMALLAAGCVLGPARDPALDEARAGYRRAANDPQVTEHAGFALREAEDSLRAAERLAAAGGEQAEIAHQVYITRQRVAIARELAAQGAAEEEMRLAEAERQQILLEARTAESQRAAEEARRAITQAEEQTRAADMARLEAQKARERARELAAKAERLSQQINELKAQETERGLVVTLGDLLFDTGEAQLNEGGVHAADQLAEFLLEYPKRNVLIEGFTDSVGAEAYNQNLSERRARAVQEQLVADGIDPDRIRTIGYGEQFPVASNETSSGRQQNRRVEVIISEPQGDILDRA